MPFGHHTPFNAPIIFCVLRYLSILNLQILVLFLQIVWIVEFMKRNSRHTELFSYSISHITLTFSWTLTLPLIRDGSHVITLPVYC
jgi:hypothetical protein